MNKGCCDSLQPSRESKDIFQRPLKWILWGFPFAVMQIGWFTHMWQWHIWSASLLWMGVACIVNRCRSGRFHCMYTGSLYIVLSLIATCQVVGTISISVALFWIVGISGTFIAFIPEFFGMRYCKVKGKLNNDEIGEKK